MEGDGYRTLVDLVGAGTLEKDFELLSGLDPAARVVAVVLGAGDEAVAAVVLEVGALARGSGGGIEEVGGAPAVVAVVVFLALAVDDVELDGEVGRGTFKGEVGVLPGNAEAGGDAVVEVGAVFGVEGAGFEGEIELAGLGVAGADLGGEDLKFVGRTLPARLVGVGGRLVGNEGDLAFEAEVEALGAAGAEQIALTVAVIAVAEPSPTDGEEVDAEREGGVRLGDRYIGVEGEGANGLCAGAWREG